MYRLLRTLTAPLLALALALAAPALAATKETSSQNWAGYAAHGKDAKFKTVTATWTQPTGDCTPGSDGFSAFWVGIGGYSLTSDALEQIGTELDCSSSGRAKLSAWYELVPAPSRTVSLAVHAGDKLTATVTVIGSDVTMSLENRTTGKTFTKTIADHTLDVTSAEWIAEAPSDCTSSGSCTTLPLADFGSVVFKDAKATTTSGKTAGIKSNLWNTTEIMLGSGSKSTAAAASADSDEATPSELYFDSTAFWVDYTGSSAASTGTGTTTTPTTTTPTGPGSGTPTSPPGTGGGGFGGGGGGGFHTRR